MGMFDDINVLSWCPACKHMNSDVQTKDLNNTLAHYASLPSGWWDPNPESFAGRAFRAGLTVFPRFPHDKAHTVWANQAEKMEAQARLPDEIAEQFKYVNVHTICRKCGVFYYGKLKVEKGMLIGDVYDVTARLDPKTLATQEVKDD